MGRFDKGPSKPSLVSSQARVSLISTSLTSWTHQPAKPGGSETRFLPSEFGNDVDCVHAVEPAKATLAIKGKIGGIVEAEGIPDIYVCCNSFAGYILPTLAQLEAIVPPRDKVVISEDGNVKAVINKEDDISTYTIKDVDDPRTLNKFQYIKPPANTYLFSDLVSLWERKISKTLERVYVPEEQVLKNIQEAAVLLNVILAISHSVFLKGDHTNFEIEPSFGVKASELYPNIKYMTENQYLNQFV
ncbi:phenylcoumaran benzylic ether reductase Pyrc5-like [Eucalyptus grandis]|uniref:phenylcoumaran benzylic ether reductase Pyrc5-like n=1 Tax=Eucalyptus grandis TaxID=71139 RepID=UPI00192E761D|nr:phenylcoumaran benzylic ether reductase Pyrc5-like [Eucalyptus grandis]